MYAARCTNGTYFVGATEARKHKEKKVLLFLFKV